jgi:Ca-activated chloride channel family protein
MVPLRCRLLCAFLLSFLSAAPGASAAPGDPPPADKTLSPYFFVEGGDPAVDGLPLDATKVEVAVTGVIADVAVTQSYRNSGKRPINAKYVFPASTRAAVHGLRMAIGNQIIVAKIKEREQASKEFDQHKKAGKTATLLEEERPNVFTMSVANVMPGDHIEVTLQYTELLVPVHGTYEFVYPTVVGPRYSNEVKATAKKTDAWVATPYFKEGKGPLTSFELRGTLSSGIPIRELASPSHRIHEQRDNPGLARFALDESERRGSNRDFVLRYGLAGDAIQSGLTLYDAGGEKFFLLVVEPPKRVTLATMPAREYVFILDVSGSMEGFPLDTAKHVLRELASGLRPTDKFNVVLFSGASRVMAPSSLQATKENVEAAMATIDKERGGGGTELYPALESAMSLSNAPGLSRSFVVVTDGYIAADKEAIDFIRAHLGDANVFAFGIGSSVNRYLIEGVAKAGQGEPFVVTEPSAAHEAAARFRDYVGAPVLTDIRVQYDGFAAADVEPASIPDVFAERPVIVHGKWRGAPTGTITVSGVSGSGVYTQRFDVAGATPRAENRALAYLWARARIANLGDFGFGETTDAARTAITALGLKYDLLTQYTSFIAVSEVVRNPGAPATDVAQPLPLPAGVSALAVGESMQNAPEPGLLLLTGLAAALLAILLFIRSSREGALVG